jgi:murein DD-endopeptidase MepM/ murein hydrolase activator NlpD
VTRRVVIVIVLLAAVLVWPVADDLLRQMPSFLLRRSPHDDYVREMRRAGIDRTEAGRAWLSAAAHALAAPDEVAMAHTRRGHFDADRTADAWRFLLRRGQRLTVDVAFRGGESFIDLFRADDGVRLASAAPESSRLTYTSRADDEVIVRVQVPLDRDGSFRAVQRAEATLRFPVERVTARAVGGGFGEGRDRGRRRHEGVDIFAPRGTPVVAAADGWITAQTTNRLGGNVVWVWSLRPRIALYYAHLDRHAVSPGDRVRAGDVLGYVGNTGNARGTAPHLHFGVYAPPAGAVDPLPFVCDAPCGERLMQPRTRPRAGSEVETDS